VKILRKYGQLLKNDDSQLGEKAEASFDDVPLSYYDFFTLCLLCLSWNRPELNQAFSPPRTIAGKATGDGFLLKKPLNRKVLKLLDALYEAKILPFGTVTRRPPASP
jgi:hypothetical protein